MDHINHIRSINNIPKMSARDAFVSTNQSFGIFCGIPFQRDQLLLNLLSSYCNKIGIVLLHNNLSFENQLGKIYTLNPSLGNTNFKMILANQTMALQSITSYYDPLYGLNDNEILNVIVPSTNYGIDSSIQQLRSILSDYLSIIKYQFSKRNDIWGNYPYSLDLLLELTSMPFDVLRNEVLTYLPNDIKQSITSRLSASGMQQMVYNAVNSFAHSISGILWTSRSFQNHTKTSIISTVANKQLLSINIPGTRPDVLDYIFYEIQHLVESNIPFLLVEYGININQSAKLKSLFLSDHSSSFYSTGIVSENTSSVISPDNPNELTDLFGQIQEMFVFSCASTISAQPFSDGIGNYFRQVTEHHVDRHRQPFRIFSGHGDGDVQRETSQKIITPEELTNLSTGCLLYGKNHPIPTLISNFIFQE